MLIPFEASGNGLKHVLKTGELRHLGIPYANFITPDGKGLDVELIQAFAKHLGVKYIFVKSTWKDIIPDLTGKIIKVSGDTVSITGKCSKKGDLISTGFTVLPWREKIVSFSSRTFPSGIWLISAMNSQLTPIKPSGSITSDIEMVKKNLQGISVLGLKGSCLAPGLYGLEKTGAKIHYFPPDHNLDEMIP
jgi:ABC-type amino acid transport substrate-binding protein